jgi:N-acylglucosamine 2-epimerase
MNNKRISELKIHYYNDLIDNTIKFWTKNCPDMEFGGYFSTIDRNGEPVSSHKSMWIQCRFIWLLSTLYNELEPRKEWLDLASHGIDFLRKHGFDKNGKMYFTVDRDGKPVRMRRYLFTEVFGVMAFAEYYRASGDHASLQTALEILDLINNMSNNPHALDSKYNPETFAPRGHSMAMIQINMLQVLRKAHPEGNYTPMIDKAIDEVLTYFVKTKEKALMEIVASDGSILRDTPEGRCVNPGHSIETAWFLMEEGKYRGDLSLINKALPILDWSLERGWDSEFGGIFSFVDLDGHQPVQVEWDMKYWWPHNESIYATLLAYSLTGESKYEDWFDKIRIWSEDHFPDREMGEWYGYLHRDGTVAIDLKASGWKGPFHLPRQQLYCYKLLDEMNKNES